MGLLQCMSEMQMIFRLGRSFFGVPDEDERRFGANDIVCWQETLTGSCAWRDKPGKDIRHIFCGPLILAMGSKTWEGMAIHGMVRM